MRRWNELLWTLGFNILLPRFFLFVLLPGFLVVPTAPHWPPLPWSYRGLPLAWAEGVIAVCLLVFGVSVAANLGISRYLRLHETPEAPYTYAYWYDWYEQSRRSSYFRIQVSDKKAFWHLLGELRRDHPREAIGRWLWVNEAVYAPPILLLSLLPTAFALVLWLVKFVGGLLTGRKPPPIGRN